MRDRKIWKDKLERLVVGGPPDAKTGLAYSAVNLWQDENFHGAAAMLLTWLVDGADDRRAAAILDLFRIVDELVPDEVTIRFLAALAKSDIDLAGTHSLFVVERLQDFLPHQAELIAELALKLVRAWQSGLADVRTATAMSAPPLADLALTLHRLGGPTREPGVTMFETLIDIDAYGARDTLMEMDGRFGPQAPAARVRVQRRREARTRRNAMRRPRR